MCGGGSFSGGRVRSKDERRADLKKKRHAAARELRAINQELRELDADAPVERGETGRLPEGAAVD